MNAVILPGKLKGIAEVPPSKSLTHRLLIRAALSEETSVIRNAGDSDDIRATLDCLTALGMTYERNGNAVIVNGSVRRNGEHVILPCRESASTMRFLLPVAAVLRDSVIVTGSVRLLERGIGVYEELFRQIGIRVIYTENGIRTEGRLKAGKYEIPGNISSQFTSGLMFALSLCEDNSRLTVLPPEESRPYADMTAMVLNRGGAEIREEGKGMRRIRGGIRFYGTDETVEGDWSAAAVFEALKTLGHEVKVTGMVTESLQGDKRCIEYLKRLRDTDPVIDLTDTPDLGPILFATSAAAGLGVVFTGTRRLSFKESDRVECLLAELAKFGVRSTARENSVRILPGELKIPSGELDGHGDHRIVAALTVLCSLTGGTIRNAEAVRKSDPDFFDRTRKLGMRIRFEETV